MVSWVGGSRQSIHRHCLFYAEVTSKKAAIKTARKLLGAYSKEIGSEFAAAVCRVLDQPHDIATFGGEVVTDQLQKSRDQLHSLTGLDSVKSTVQELINIAKVAQMQVQAGIKAPTITRHLVFTGNPGTGKTTVARILGEIYNNLGVLSKGHLLK
jgi:ATP-dependent Lon protease